MMERQMLYRRKEEARPGSVREAQVIAPAVRQWADSLLAAAAAAGGELLGIAARDYARCGRTRTAEALLNADAEFEKWKIAWMRENRGRNALDAQRAFVEKHAEISLAALEQFGGEGEVFRDELVSGLRLRGLHALQEGGQYQMREEQAWHNSVFAAEKGAFMRTIEENPENGEWLAMRGSELLQSWEAKNPGLDAGAMRQEIISLIARGRTRSLIAKKDYEGAQRLLDGYAEKYGIGEAANSVAPDPIGAAQRAVFQCQIEGGIAARTADARNAEIRETAGSLAARLAPLPAGEREGALRLETENIADQAMREEIMRRARAQMAENDRLARGREAAQAYEAMAGASDADRKDIMAKLDNCGAAAKKLAQDWLAGRLEEDGANQAAFNRLLSQIDAGQGNGRPVGANDVFAFALANRMTPRQARMAADYAAGGSLQGLSMRKLREVHGGLQGPDGGADMPPWLFTAVLEELGKGEKMAGVDAGCLRQITAGLLIRRAGEDGKSAGKNGAGGQRAAKMAAPKKDADNEPLY